MGLQRRAMTVNLLAIVIMVAVIAALAPVDQAAANNGVLRGPFTIRNNTGMAQSHVEIVLAGTGGTLNKPQLTLIPNAPFCPPPMIIARLNTVVIHWPFKCVPNGASVGFVVFTKFDAFNPEAEWSNRPVPISVGGISRGPGAGAAPAQAPRSSGTDLGLLAALIAGTAAGAVALGSAAWYARRRWVR